MTEVVRGKPGQAWARSDGGWVTLDDLQDTSHQVAPNLFQGGLNSASVPGPGFDVIVNVSAHSVRPRGIEKTGALYIEWGIFDSSAMPDPTMLHPLVDLIAELLFQGKRVLVHCQAGLNRSGLVCALTMRARGVPADDAIDSIRKHRCEFGLCNADFERYVREWTP